MAQMQTVPNLRPYLDPLPARFPNAWAKCRAPHDDGEFNARAASVLFYEHGLTQAGRNGKRGDPNNLSRDIINWRAIAPEVGQNPDPVNGGSGTIVDIISGHEGPNAAITQGYPDPNGPGAWVRPKTLAEIDVEYGVAPAVPPFPPRNETMDFGLALNGHYQAKGAGQNGSLGGRFGDVPRYTDYEGEVIWTSEYLRRRQLGEAHAEATANVLADVDAAWPK